MHLKNVVGIFALAERLSTSVTLHWMMMILRTMMVMVMTMMMVIVVVVVEGKGG